MMVSSSGLTTFSLAARWKVGTCPLLTVSLRLAQDEEASLLTHRVKL